MGLRRFYQLAAALPLLVPALSLVLAAAVQQVIGSGANPGVILYLALIAALQLSLGGVPYVIFAVSALWWLRRKSVDEIAAFSLVAPLLFAAFMFLGVMLLSASGGLDELIKGFPMAGLLALLSVVFGYLYVALAHALRFGLERAGYIRRSPAA